MYYESFDDDRYDYECDKADFDPSEFDEEETDQYEGNGFNDERDFWAWKGF